MIEGDPWVSWATLQGGSPARTRTHPALWGVGRRLHGTERPFLCPEVDLSLGSLQPPTMRTSWLVLGALGWVVACGDDGSAPPSITDTDAGGETGDSSAQTGTQSGHSSGQSTHSSASETPSGSASSGGGGSSGSSSSSSGGASGSGSGDGSSASMQNPSSSGSAGSSSDATDAGCQDQCDEDAVRCTGEGATTVEQCRVAPSTGCTTWQAVEDCTNGSCLGDLVDEACNPEADIAQCGAAGLTVCAPGPLGCPIWQAPTEAMLTEGDVDIDEGATSFTAYGVLELKLTSDVDAADMVACLTDTREVATAADSPIVTQVSETASATYDLELSRYQLPVAYELSVAVRSPPVVRTTVLTPDEKSRVAFISKTKGNGDLASWTAANDTPLEAADAVCQSDAEAAGLSGTFRAYLSIKDQTDAICRLRGGEGLLADECGLGASLAEDQLTAPFLNLKGMPITYGTADVESGFWRLPVGYQADGKASGFGVAAWTGSTMAGAFAAYECDGWSSAEGVSRGNATANPGLRSTNEAYTLSCDDENALLCFSAGTGHGLSDLHEKAGKLAYLLELPLGSYIDIELADAACREASGKDNVIAWYSDEQDDALCRLAGVSGKVADSCEGSGLGDASGPWVRADGYLLAETVGDLTKGPLAPLNLDKDGNYSAPGNRVELVRTDTLDDGTRGNAMAPCVNGDRLSIGSGWTYYSGSCATAGNYRPFVYCFEQ